MSRGKTEGEGQEILDPVEFFYNEHERIRRACEALGRLAEAPASADAAREAGDLLAFLERDLGWHIEDEEQDLFPLLRARSPAGDDVFSVLELLCREHQDDIETAGTLRRVLAGLARGEKPRDPELFADYVRAYVRLQRRHHALENNRVMPLVEERLSPEDLKALARRMAARRRTSG